ncbi:palmitoyltransferase for Vac8p [Podila humilis]|nr:palmitoyltransferase for Vac8p [Podila humilis]
MTHSGTGPSFAEFKVHPSALAPGSTTAISGDPDAGTESQTLAPSQTMTALAAAQRAAALASQDNNHQQTSDENHDPSAGCFLDLISRSLPLLLTAGIVYIYYVYTFRVCLDYILRIQHNKTLAVVYLSAFNTFTVLFFVSYARSIFRSPGSPLKPPARRPMPPVPPTSTPYQAQRRPKTTSRPIDEAFNHPQPLAEDIHDTTPLLKKTRTQAASYQSTSMTIATRQDHAVIKIGSPQNEETPVATLSISKRDGRPRWCDICNIVKPDRCHHCSECDQCVLRMDHHCPWVNGCIGYNNHKFFYLFIFYGSVLALWVVATMIPLLISALRNCEQDLLGGFNSVRSNSMFATTKMAGSDLYGGDGGGCHFDFHWPIITVISLLLALMIVSFTVAHTAYILQNRTTIESLQDVRNTYVRVQYRKPDQDNATLASVGSSNDGLTSSSSTVIVPPFPAGPDFNVVLVQPGEQLWDRGSWLANWKSIMGPSWWLWFVPYGNTMGDGIHEVYNDKAYHRIVGEALAQARSQSSGLNPIFNEEHRVDFTHHGFYSTEAGHNRYEYLHAQGSPAAHHRPNREHYLPVSRVSPIHIDHSAEDSEASVGSMGRSLPTPHSSPRIVPLDL